MFIILRQWVNKLPRLNSLDLCASASLSVFLRVAKLIEPLDEIVAFCENPRAQIHATIHGDNRARDNYIETIKYILKDYITLQRDTLKHQTPWK